ncbi:MAG: circadian clock protein KaiC [Acidobacteria bacterium]|nr:circadian clock protein KaiC [Acidobacteriota bacterium]MCA1649706.1 circadian clock protein KaiC [Acidobacteriota bacterium]
MSETVSTRDPSGDPRTVTGIAGLDALLAGGLPPRRLHLVEGDPGTGKTTLGLQFLLEGHRRGESCLYVTLSETVAELRAVAASHGWSLEGIHLYELNAGSSGKVDEEYTLYHPSEIELTEMAKGVVDMTERTRPARVVLDSLSEMRLLARDPLRYRRQILSLKQYFDDRGCTVVMLDDHTGSDQDLQLGSIAHGVLLLEQTPFDYGRSRRRLRIVKMRGVAVIEGFHDFKIHRGGIAVYPQLIPRGSQRVRNGKLLSGIDALDRLTGAGLSWGTCCLFLGPAGVGKSTVAAQFLTAGEVPGAVYLFDERRATFINRCDALGMEMSARVDRGQIAVEQVEPGELSPGEFAHCIRRRVEEHGCRIVLIDSLNGYLHAIPTGHAPLVRMHELIAYLNDEGVATLLVSALHGFMGTAMTAPIDISYLADTVIMLRYFEAAGSVRKAISVVKKRTGGHETLIREFAVGPDHLRVGEPLSEFQGVITGVPQYRGHAEPLPDPDDRSRR